MTKHLVVWGNPIDGFTFRGPFDSREEAILYAEDVGDGDWWLADLDPPLDSRHDRE